MSGTVLNFTPTMAYTDMLCGTCGITFAVPQGFYEGRRLSHATWYCPNGHERYYPGKSDVEKLRDELADKERQLVAERERAATNYAAREKAEREAKRLKKRISGGACPCCKRSFVGLARHMKTKHPEFAPEQS